tara:strand:+ start:401 stop:526 length:126 start_codon:yes stop_codon:yes gene_type:complete
VSEIVVVDLVGEMGSKVGGEGGKKRELEEEGHDQQRKKEIE